MELPPLEPESSASANSATSAYTVAAASKPEPLALACFVEQVMGVEPTSSAWKADVLAVVRHLRISSCVGCEMYYSTVFYKTQALFQNIFQKIIFLFPEALLRSIEIYVIINITALFASCTFPGQGAAVRCPAGQIFCEGVFLLWA